MLPPPSIVNEFGSQLLKAKDLPSALAAFRYNTELYPEFASLWYYLGDALDQAGYNDEAAASYRKALSIAEAKGDPNLEMFRKQVRLVQ
jgi:tetratricopeptide (TPR) repeat protein